MENTKKGYFERLWEEKEMLDGNDKKWITETIDEKLYGTKTELRGEMQEMKEEIITQVTFVIENTIGDDMKFIRENVPDITRSYDLVMDNQFQQQEDIKLLKTISTDHENRINKLEKVMV